MTSNPRMKILGDAAPIISNVGVALAIEEGKLKIFAEKFFKNWDNDINS